MSVYWDKRRVKEQLETYRGLVGNIFKDIDELILNCITTKPIPFNESKFKLEYEKLKQKWFK